MPNRSAVHYVINSARKQLNMSERDLWIAYRAYGGSVSEQAISEFLRGVTTLSEQDVNSLAIALNERFTGDNPESLTQRVEGGDTEWSGDESQGGAGGDGVSGD